MRHGLQGHRPGEPTIPGPRGEGAARADVGTDPASLADVQDSLASYDPVREDVPVGAAVVPVLRPRSAEDLIDEGEYAREERLPYWAELWPSARVLAERLAARPPRGLAVVELGCGVGLPSVGAARGGARVLATDWYAPALAFTRANAAATGVALETMLVDWRDPPAALLTRPPADLVIGADLLYEDRNGPTLAALLPRLLRPGGEALIADPRRPGAARLIDPLRAAGWAHSREDVTHRGRPDESGAVIHLHRLHIPGA